MGSTTTQDYSGQGHTLTLSGYNGTTDDPGSTVTASVTVEEEITVVDGSIEVTILPAPVDLPPGFLF